MMTQSILGLDLGTSSLKAVCLRKGLMALEWAGGYQKDLPRTVSAFDWAKESFAGLKEWIAENRLPMDRVVVSIPAHLVSLRSLTLPFGDPRRLEKVVAYEVESLLPYALEEVIVDYHIAAQADGKTHLLVAAVPRELLRGCLNQLASAGIDPEAVELDGLALLNWARYLQGEPSAPSQAQDRDVSVVEIGASKTLLCILRRGQAAFVRTILWGGRNITAALQQQCGVPFEEAEEWKRQAGLMDEGITRLHQKGVSPIIRRSLDPLVDELTRTLHVYQTEPAVAGDRFDERETAPGLILCGGGSKLKGLEACLASELGMQPMASTPRLLSANGARWDPGWAISLGLALKATRLSGGSRMNFRKEEFVYARDAAVSSSRLRYLWIAALLVALVAGADLYAKYRLELSAYQTLKAEVRKQFLAMFPDVKNVVDEVQQAKAAMAELKKKSTLFGAGGPTPLQWMAELTQRMPTSVRVEVQDLVIEPGRMRLEAETDSFESVDKIKASLGKFELFKEITVSDAKVSADQSRVRFRLTITLAAPESA